MALLGDTMQTVGRIQQLTERPRNLTVRTQSDDIATRLAAATNAAFSQFLSNHELSDCQIDAAWKATQYTLRALAQEFAGGDIQHERVAFPETRGAGNEV